MQIIVKKVKLIWQNPYVCDGLVAHWDGEWNAGGGRHDPNATAIHELVTGKSENLASAFRAGPNYYEVTTQSLAGRLTALSAAFALAIESGFARLETIAFVNAPATAIYGNSLSLAGGTFGYQPETGRGGANLLGSGWLSAKDPMIVGAPFARLVLTVDAAAQTITYQVGDAQATGSFTMPQTVPTSCHIVTVGTRLYCIRVYNRPLTDAEIAANLKIDRQRFGF